MTQAQSPAGAAAPPEAPSVGGDTGDGTLPRRFGKYTLIRKLAVGGMAELYLALQRSVAGFEKLIVVKRILPHLAQDKSFVDMLLDEARIAATLNHPNVAHIYDVGVWENEYFIAMEHIHGEDLRSIVRQMKKRGVTSFPLEHALAIVLGCCKGLAYAHEKQNLDGEPLNIVHRDVSPQNILVTFTGDVKLVDFGIAKAGRSNLEDSKSGKLKGKIPYMSPEQAQGRVLDARSDIFSLGVMLFELCTGKRLFRGTNEFDTLRLIVEGEYPQPRSLNPALAPRLEEIILRALEKDRNKRYASARDMQADLEAFIREEQLAVSPISLGEWMQNLFDEKLAAQKQMLQEGRQLAEVFAAQLAEDDTQHTGSSGVRPRASSKIPWVLLGLVLLIGVAGGGALWWKLRQDAAAATGPGVLRITSTPAGAAVWIDGDRRRERTPAALNGLPLGAYDVKLTVDGYVPFTRRVELTEAAPRAEVSATLERLTANALAAVRVRTTPAGARVIFDGRETGRTTPATVSDIAPGVAHTLALTLDGYVTKTIPLTLRPGQVEEVAFQLERTPLGPDEAILHIEVLPVDARVSFDGRVHDTGSPYEFRTTAQAHRVIVMRSGYDSINRDIELPGGEVTELRLELQRERRRNVRRGGDDTQQQQQNQQQTQPSGPGRLTFDARPWCNVTIDGRAVGQTPIVNRELESGSHRVVCTNPELSLSRTVNVTIRPGETTRHRVDLQ